MHLTALLDDVVAVPKPIRTAVAHLLGFDDAERLYESLKTPVTDRAIPERLLNRLAVTYRIGERDLQQIPKSGPVVVVANHPFGILEGAVLATALARVRPDVRFLANDVLSAIPEIKDLLIPVDAMGGSSAAQRNTSGLRRSIEFLQGGGCLVVFPAG